MERQDENIEAVRKYQKELKDWYADSSIPENPFSTTTQDLWYQHYLNKKRVYRLGMHMVYQPGQAGDVANVMNELLSVGEAHYDGRTKISKIRNLLNYCLQFCNSEGVVYENRMENQMGEYYVMSSRSEQGQLICPKCGNVGTTESMIDGCDYCGTKFSITDLECKVSSLYLPKTVIATKNKQSLIKEFLPFVLLALIPMLSLNLFVWVPAISAYGSIAYGVAFVCFIPLFFKVRKFMTERGTAKAMKTIDVIHYNDPYFSEEAFIGGVTNKILSIHYAEQPEEVAALALCNLSGILMRYHNVLFCATGQYDLISYEEDSLLAHIKLEYDVDLITVEPGSNQCKMEKEKVWLHMVKKSSVHSTLVNDALIFTCTSCGNSISLLNGGRCEACGRTINLSDYDWIISEYKIK